MKKRFIWVIAAIGFMMPIVWGIMELVFMHARLAPRAERTWNTLRLVTCPVWNLDLPGFASIGFPILNAMLYAGVTSVVLKVAENVHRAKVSSSHT